MSAHSAAQSSPLPVTPPSIPTQHGGPAKEKTEPSTAAHGATAPLEPHWELVAAAGTD